MKHSIDSLRHHRFRPQSGQVVIVQYGYEEGDGISGWYRWDATSTATDDDSNIIQPNHHAGPGRWSKIPVSSGGAIGPTGPTGPAGNNGATGPEGPRGLQGDPGTPGATGANGIDGATGPAGGIGPTGPQGLTGPAGQDSIVAGPQGPTGPAGLDGATGPSGATGADGTPGSPGATGPAGPTGPTGAAGFSPSTTTTASYVQPETAATVEIRVVDGTWIATGAPIYVTGGGIYTKVSATDETHVVVRNTGATGNATPSATVESGQTVTPSGMPGVQGIQGNQGITGPTGPAGGGSWGSRF